MCGLGGVVAILVPCFVAAIFCLSPLGVVLSCSSVAFGVLLALSCATRMSMEVSN